MTASEVKDLISPIPSEDIITNKFTKNGKCCIIGHLSRLTSKDINDYSIVNCRDYEFEGCEVVASEGKEVVFEFARRKTAQFLLGDTNAKVDFNIDNTLSNVNNGEVSKYNQNTPKGRIMACLDDMIEAGY